MFHRVNTVSQDAENKHEDVQEEPNQTEQPVMEHAAVDRYTKINGQQDEFPANQNRVAATQSQDFQPTQLEKDTQNMNTADSQAKTDKQSSQENAQSGQARSVDIPGAGFQRPGQPSTSRVPGAYPGAYPGAPSSAGAASPYASGRTSTANDFDNGRKLLIGQGITLSGEIESCDHLVVEGTVEAALKGASVMDIAESGAFYGTVEIDEATVAGRFEGDLTVKGRLTIRSTGSITGAIAYKELAVEAGATLDGKVSPLEGKNQSAARKGADKFVKGKDPRKDDGDQLPFSDKAAAE